MRHTSITVPIRAIFEVCEPNLHAEKRYLQIFLILIVEVSQDPDCHDFDENSLS